MADSSRRSSFEEIPYAQRVVLSYLMKPSAVLSFSVCTIVSIQIFRDKKRMSYMYHRLALAMCIISSVNSFVVFFQNWSIPSGTAGCIHAFGNIATCTLTGFLNQVGLANQYYYVSLSIYVFFALKCEFRQQNIKWIEKYIHFGAFVIPVGSAIYLAYAEMFNPIGSFCWINAAPEGCDREYSPCVRGSKNIATYVFIFGIIPTACNLIIAPIIIFACYMIEQLKHKKNVTSGRLKGKMIILERARREKSMLIVRQGAIYLLTFYMSYIIPSIAATMQVATQRHNFYLTALSQIFYPMDGLFFTMGYLYLRERKPEVNIKVDDDPENKTGRTADNENITVLNKKETLTLPNYETNFTHENETKRSVAVRRESWCVPNRPNEFLSARDPMRKSFSVSLFDGTDEDKWKAFGVYLGSDSDSDSDS